MVRADKQILHFYFSNRISKHLSWHILEYIAIFLLVFGFSPINSFDSTFSHTAVSHGGIFYIVHIIIIIMNCIFIALFQVLKSLYNGSFIHTMGSESANIRRQRPHLN